MDHINDGWNKICEHFGDQIRETGLPNHGELKSYMEKINIELMIDVDIDDDFVDSITNQLWLAFGPVSQKAICDKYIL